jgi:YaiO family outer membrane protein
MIARAILVIGLIATPMASAAWAGDVELLYQQGVAARLAGDLDTAIARLRAAAALAPRDADTALQLGLALAAAGAWEEAEASLRRTLDLAPGYADARIGLARLALQNGDPATAEVRLAPVLAADADNLDALVLQGRIAMARSAMAEAEAAFGRALAVEPDYVDALVGLGDARLAAGREAGARQAFAQALSRDPASAEIAGRLAAATPLLWRLDIGVDRSSLDTGDDWRTTTLRLTRRLSADASLSLAAEASQRFGLSDTFVELRLDGRVAPNLTGHVLLGATPDADFRPQRRLGIGAELALGRPLGAKAGDSALRLDLRHDRYRDTDVLTVSPSFRHSFLDGDLALTVGWTGTYAGSTHASGLSARVDLKLRDDIDFFAGYSDAPEITDGSPVGTTSLYGGLAWQVDDRLTLRAAILRERRETGQRRTEVALGLVVRF